MSTDDESLLGEYLDGELEPEQQQAVEASLATNPQFAEQGERLSYLHDLVANLSRPACPDIVPEVMRRVRQASLRRRPWTYRHSARRWGVVGIAVTAMAAIALLANFNLRDHDTIDNHFHGGAAPSSAPAVDNSSTPASNATITVKASHPDMLPVNVFGPEERAIALSTATAWPETQTEHERVRKLLDDPHLRRVFLVADQIGRPAEEQVASIVERTTHRDYFKITVSQGIVIDPRHPGRATVFAVVLDENELEPFRDRLKQTFSDRVQEDDINPAVAMQLADIGQVVSFPANPVGDLRILRSDLALRVSEAGEAGGQEPAPLAAIAEVNQPTVEQERSSPAAALARLGAIKQESGSPAVHLEVTSEKAANRVAHTPADDDQPGEAGNSRSKHRGAIEGAPRIARAHDIPPSNERHLVVLVWVSDTSSG
jgi:hypothetical protein